MTDPTLRDRFLKQLRDTVAEYRNHAATYAKLANEARERVAELQRVVDADTAEADCWQKLLDFTVLSDSDNELAHAFANAVLNRNAEMEAAREPEPTDGLLPDPLVMDAEEYHASIWTGAIATASTAQLEGVACINCARVFGSEPNYPAATGPRGPLFAHSNPDDCKGAAK